MTRQTRGLPRRSPRAVVALVAFAGGLARAAAGPRVLGHGRAPGGRPAASGTAHPTGFPTYVLLGWLASVVLQPFGEPAFRMNLLSAICVAVAAGVTVDLVRKPDRLDVLGVAAGIGLALTPVAWAIATHAEAAFPPPRARGDPAVAAGRAGTSGSRRATTVGRRRRRAEHDRELARRDRGDRYLIAAAVVFGLAVGNHSLTLLLAIPVGLYVLAVDPGIWRRGRLVLGCVAALALTVALVYLELPFRAGPFRARARLRHPEHLGRLPLHRPRGAVPGQPVGPIREPAGASSAQLVGADGRPVRHPRAAHPDRVRRRPPSAGRATRC